MPETTKVCTVCSIEKAVDDYYFYSYHGGFRRRQSHCKSCHNAKIKERREHNPAKEAERRHAQEAKYDKVKKAAKNAVGRAVAAGELVKPETCERCGSVGRLEGHHADYSKQLDVEWLCRSCHAAEHVRLASAA